MTFSEKLILPSVVVKLCCRNAAALPDNCFETKQSHEVVIKYSGYFLLKKAFCFSSDFDNQFQNILMVLTKIILLKDDIKLF